MSKFRLWRPVMYVLTVKQSFDAAHLLKGYQGKCSNLHGHTWNIEVAIAGNELNQQGMLIDFGEIKASLKNILSKYDHTFLNELPEFVELNPTAENMARIIYYKLKRELATGLGIDYVRVWESSATSALFKE